MKETIYTIPINEIFDKPCFCPFCSLEKRLEEEEVEYALGPAMMETDYRALINKDGFCREHTKKLNALPKVLPLAIVLKSRLNTVMPGLKLPPPEKRRIGFKSKGTELDEYIKNASALGTGCVICNRLNANMDRYFDTFIYMLSKEREFFDKVRASDGFCLPHYSKALLHAKKALKSKELYNLVSGLHEIQLKKLSKYKKDTESFIESFDYKNAGKPCPVSGDTVTKTSFLIGGEFDPLKKTLKGV